MDWQKNHHDEHSYAWLIWSLLHYTISKYCIRVIRIHQRINGISFVRDGCLCWGAHCPFFLLTDSYSELQLQWRRHRWNAIALMEEHFPSFPMTNLYDFIDKKQLLSLSTKALCPISHLIISYNEWQCKSYYAWLIFTTLLHFQLLYQIPQKASGSIKESTASHL